MCAKAKLKTRPEQGTVLVVDDERSIVETLSAVLEVRGFRVLEADSAERALRIIEQGPAPDAVVLDVLLPGISGLELCQMIRDNDQLKSVPVLMITVITRDTDLADGFWKIGTQADDFVTKPFDPFVLADRVERLLAGSQGEKHSVC